MEVQTDSERVRTSRKMVLEFLGSSVDISLAGAGGAGRLDRGLCRALRRGSRRYGPPAAPRRRGRARRARAGPPPRRGRRRDGRDRRPADQDRQRPLRPRLLEVHPLLQVRRGVRRGRPEHVRDRGRRARVRRADLDRAGGPPPRVRVRLLRQLHRRLPDRRADGQARVRHARGGDVGPVAADRDRDDLPVLRRRLRRRAPRPGREDPQGDLAAGTRRSRTATCASRAASASSSSTSGPPKRDRTGR